MTEWLQHNWIWLATAFWIAEKGVKLSKSKYDDIIVDMVWSAMKRFAGKGS